MPKKKKDSLDISENIDKRGFSLGFKNIPLKQFHIVSINPDSTRGNHSHDYQEVICVFGGKDLAEITLEGPEISRKFIVADEYQVIIIPAHVKHTVRNIGYNVFYLVSFASSE